MIKFITNSKNIFKVYNLLIVALYLYPGSFLGCIFYKNCGKQPQLTKDFYDISSNHVYVFILLSILGLFAYAKEKKIKYLMLYLFSISIILELFHLLIPKRGFEYSDLYGNILGVLIVFFIYLIYIFLKKYAQK